MQLTHPSSAEITTAIKQSFAEVAKQLGGGKSDREWTTKIKEAIGNLGVSHGWDICTSGFPDRFEAEWLYDLVWYHNDSDGPDAHLTEVHLVMESEWGKHRNAIKYDFEKLLLAKAALKLMVFQTDNNNISELFNLLEQGIHAFKKGLGDETYILAAFNNSAFAFDVRQIKGA